MPRTLRMVDVERVGRLMGRLGWAYTVGMFLSISFDGRSLLLGPAAVVAAVTLVSLAEAVDSGPARRLLNLAAVAAGASGALSAVVLVPGSDDAGPAVLGLVLAAVATALYAHGMGRWCASGGWRTIAGVWRRATRAALVGVATSVGLVVVVLQGDPATGPTPEDGITPDVAFGRVVEDAGPTWWLLCAAFAVAVVTAWRIATGHRSMRAAFEVHGAPTVAAVGSSR